MHAGSASGRRRLLLGAVLVAAAGLMFALAGTGIKMAGESLPFIDVLLWRNVLSLAILTPWICWHWPRSLRPAHGGLMALRGVALVAALLCYYYAVSVLPLAEAVLLNFSAPIFVPLLGFLLFRFALDRNALAAVLIGFAGVVLILKPGTDFFQPMALIGLASGVLGGLSAVAIWRMPAHEDPIRIAVYFAGIGILITLGPVLVLSEPALPPADAWPGLVHAGRLLHRRPHPVREGLSGCAGRPGRHAGLHIGGLRRPIRLALLGRAPGLAQGRRHGAGRRRRDHRRARRRAAKGRVIAGAIRSSPCRR